MSPDGVRRVIAAHQVAVQEHRVSGASRAFDAATDDRRRRGQHELHRVLHRLRGIVKEHVHRPRTDIDGEDARIGHEPMLSRGHMADREPRQLDCFRPDLGEVA